MNNLRKSSHINVGPTNRKAQIMKLEARYDLLSSRFDLGEFQTRGDNLEDIKSYYIESEIGYRIFHSQEGSIHMALNTDDQFNESGYSRTPNLISERIPERANAVLELGCGKGFNLRAVGERLVHVNFWGIDLVPMHIRKCERALADLPNVSVRQGDFADLPYDDASFDALFSIESLCHALRPATALREASRVARPDGRLIVVDAWRTDAIDSASTKVKRAIELTERSMSVGNALKQSVWIDAANEAGWILDETLPLSHEIMPTLRRFERGAELALRSSLATRLVRRVVPKRLVGNVVAGYLMSQSIREGYHKYELLVLKKAGRRRTSGRKR